MKNFITKTFALSFLLLLSHSAFAQNLKVYTGYRYQNNANKIPFKYTKQYIPKGKSFATLYKLYFVDNNSVENLKPDKRFVAIHFPEYKEISMSFDTWGIEKKLDTTGAPMDPELFLTEAEMIFEDKQQQYNLATVIYYDKPSGKIMEERGIATFPSEIDVVPTRLQVKFRDKDFKYVDVGKMLYKYEYSGFDVRNASYDFYVFDEM